MSERLSVQVSVFVVILDEQRQVLLQRRQNTGFLDGYYDFPSGHIELGESIHQAAIRELEEEAGVIAAVDDLELIHISQNFIDTPYFNFTFMARSWTGTPKIGEPERCDDMGFYDPNDLPAKCSLNVRLIERQEFTDKLTYSRVSKDDFEKLVLRD